MADSPENIRERLAELNEFRKEFLSQLKSLSEIEQQAKKTSDEWKAAEKERLSLIQQIKDTQKANIKESVDGLESIGSLYSKFTDTEKERLTLLNENVRLSKNLIPDEAITLSNELASINREIAQLDTSRIEKISSLNEKFQTGLMELKQYSGIQKYVVNLLTAQNSLANDYASATKEQKDYIQEQLDLYEKMRTTVQKTLETVFSAIRTPEAMIIAASVAAGKFASALGDVNKKTGVFMGSTAALSFVFDDAVNAFSQISKLSGDFNNATFGAQLNVGVLATSLGISGDQAATLVNAFGNLQGSSRAIGEELTATVANTARLNGVLPSQVMEDIASASEEMALYSKGTGENFAKAAIQAAKLGSTITTISKISDKLLDFETSIESELEASAILGKDLNLTRARELAYVGDIEGSTREILTQLGGINEFNKMDVFQKQSVADTLGITVAELQQIIANQDNLATSTGSLERGWGVVNDYIRTIADKFGGPIASGVTFFVSELIRAKMLSAALSGGGFLNTLTGGLFGKKTSTPSPVSSIGGEQKSTSAGINKLGTINGASLLQGAAAMLIMAGALWVISKAIQEFKNVEWTAVAQAITTLMAMAISIRIVGASLSSAAPQLGLAALVLIGFASALYIVGAAIKLFAEGFKIIGDELMVLSTINLMPLMGLAGALYYLAASFVAVAAAGVLALPVLSGINMISSGISTMMGSQGNDTDKKILEQISGLREDLNNGKVAVYLDGHLVTERVIVANRKNPVN